MTDPSRALKNILSSIIAATATWAGIIAVALVVVTAVSAVARHQIREWSGNACEEAKDDLSIRHRALESAYDDLYNEHKALKRDYQELAEYRR